LKSIRKLLVSVIMPVHNRFALVDEAVKSVNEQTYCPIKLIIVDDFSDEPYIPNIDSKEGLEIVVTRHETNRGPGASRETGRLAAQGEYIAYLDSDDLWHPEKLEKQVATLQAHPQSGMCYCQTTQFSKLPLTGDEPIRKNSNIKYDEFLPIILDARPWCTSSCLWTRYAVEKIGPWINSWHYEDVEYDTRAGCHEIEICYTPEILCYYRLTENNDSLSNSLSKFSVSQQTRSVLQIGEDLQHLKKIEDKDIRYFYNRRLFKTAFEAIDHGERKSAFILFKKMLQTTSSIKEKVIVLFLLCACVIIPVNIMNSIKYRLKKYITKGNFK